MAHPLGTQFVRCQGGVGRSVKGLGGGSTGAAQSGPERWLPRKWKEGREQPRGEAGWEKGCFP